MSAALRVALVSFRSAVFAALHAGCVPGGHHPALCVTGRSSKPRRPSYPNMGEKVTDILGGIPVDIDLVLPVSAEGLGRALGHARAAGAGLRTRPPAVPHPRWDHVPHRTGAPGHTRRAILRLRGQVRTPARKSGPTVFRSRRWPARPRFACRRGDRHPREFQCRRPVRWADLRLPTHRWASTPSGRDVRVRVWSS